MLVLYQYLTFIYKTVIFVYHLALNLRLLSTIMANSLKCMGRPGLILALKNFGAITGPKKA